MITLPIPLLIAVLLGVSNNAQTQHGARLEEVLVKDSALDAAHVALMTLQASVSARTVRAYRLLIATAHAKNSRLLTSDEIAPLLVKIPKPTKCLGELEGDTLNVRCERFSDIDEIDFRNYLPERLENERQSFGDLGVAARGDERILFVYHDRRLVATWNAWVTFRSEYYIFFGRSLRPLRLGDASGAVVQVRLTPPVNVKLKFKKDTGKGKQGGDLVS